MKFLLIHCGSRSLAILFSASFCILILDLLGIALIFPFLSIFITPQLILSNRYVSYLYHLCGFENINEFIYAAGTLLIVVYVIKFAFKTGLNAVKNRTIANITYKLSSGLIRGLLHARYALFTDQSASEMINIVNAQTIHSVICLESFVKALNELTFLAVIIAIALFINPGITLFSILVFVAIGASLYFGLVKKIGAFGKIHLRLNVLVYKYGFAMANSIKDIKIMRLENEYIKKYSSIWEEYSHNEVDQRRQKEFLGICLRR
jgi:ABC-type bacteriocin/lantibiotic exporter with double-glycine peptidase domain